VNLICRTFLDDTGACHPTIYIDDLEEMVQKAGGKKAPFLCMEVFQAATGHEVTEPVIKLHFNIEWPDKGCLAQEEWIPVQTSVTELPYDPSGPPRLSGMWLRYHWFVATVPNNKGELHISETMAGIRSKIQTCDVRAANPMPLELPQPEDEHYNALPSATFRDLLYVPPNPVTAWSSTP
jgi:hypothetical protein